MPSHASIAALDEMGVDYFEAEGEAANWISKLEQLSEKKGTFLYQLDFLSPERFDKYIRLMVKHRQL